MDQGLQTAPKGLIVTVTTTNGGEITGRIGWTWHETYSLYLDSVYIIEQDRERDANVYISAERIVKVVTA